MNKPIEINDFVWHPCSLDIIQYKVTCIKQFDGFNHYVLKAVKPVGACGRIEVIIDEHKGKLRFVELIDGDEIPYSKGLQDFVEGNYFTDKREAQLEFYEKQRILTWSSMENRKRDYEAALKNYERVNLLVKTITDSIKEISI